MSSALRHVRQNAVAYLALFVALGGTSYAAINLPKGSVGSSQLRNHSITPGKFNGKYINGSVRAWAVVGADGTVQSGAGKPNVTVIQGTPNSYVVTWKNVQAPTQRGCFALGGLSSNVNGAGSISAFLNAAFAHSWRVSVCHATDHRASRSASRSTWQ